MNVGFESVHGQSRAKLFIKNLLKKDRVPHALLITGGKGVGKRNVATALASGLMCLNLQEDGEPCGSCSSCRRLISDTNPDLMIVSPDGESLKIDQLRSIIPELKFPPYFSRNRVVILENSERMTDEASNAVLKTLEEPPPQNFFILLADSHTRLLPTIVSRCCHIRLGPIGYDELKSMALNDGLASEEMASLCAMLARGSRSNLTEWIQEENRLLWSKVDNWVRGLRDIPFWRFFSEVRDLVDEFESMEKFTYLLKMWLMLFIREQIRSRSYGADFDLRLVQLLDIFDKIEESEQMLQFNANRLLVAEELGLVFRERMYEEDCWG